MTLRRTALWSGAALAALLAGVAIAVALAVHRPQMVRPWVERALAPRGGTASLSGLKISLSPPSLELSGLSIAGPPADGDRLRLERLRCEFLPARLFGGGPWLRHVEARGLSFERTRPREAAGPPDLTPLTRLFDLEDLSLTDARLRVALTPGVLAADDLALRLAPADGGVRAFAGHGRLAFRRGNDAVFDSELSVRGTVSTAPGIDALLELASGRLTSPWLEGRVSGRSRVRVDRRRIELEDLALSMEQGRLRVGHKGATLGPSRLAASAGATLSGTEPRIHLRELDLAGLLHAQGEMSGPTLDSVSGSVEGEIPQARRALAGLAPLLPAPLAALDLSGALPYRLRLAGGGPARTLVLELLPEEVRVSWPDKRFACRLEGTLRAEGPVSGWRRGDAVLSGQLRGTGGLTRPPLALRAFRFDARIGGRIAALRVPAFRVSIDADNLLYEGRPLPLGALELRGVAGTSGRAYRLDGLDIRSAALGRFTGGLESEGDAVRGRLEGSGVPVDNLALLSPALGGPPASGWSPAGAIDVSARLAPVAGGHRVTATAAADNLGFASPAGDVLGQNLSATAALDALLLPKPRVKADLAVRRGEALWGTVYVDFAGNPLELHAEGIREAPEEYRELAIEGTFGGFGRARVEASLRRAGGGWRHQGRLAVTEARLAPVFRTFVRDPLAPSHRELAGLEMNGTARLDLSFSGVGTSADLSGALQVRAGRLGRETEPPVLSGFGLDLPIGYALGAPNPGLSPPTEGSRWGRLHLETLRVADQTLGPVDIAAVLVPNRLFLAGSLDASLFGARLSLRDIEVNDPLSRNFQVRMAATIDRLDLGRVAGDNTMLQGHLGGTLNPVTMERDRLAAAGELTGDLFGGRLDIRHLTVERPFGAGRELGADVTVDRIDLERLSAVLGVGRITGRLSGTARGLRLAYGQPVAFHLRMMSVPVEGVTQSVSLKAVNSISLVSTGSGLSGLGSSLMTTFFREFPYERIGFGCDLKNDVFTVRGLIHEDGVEYLVKRRFFGGINVINRNPDNRIGFSDMVERAKRATAERSN